MFAVKQTYVRRDLHNQYGGQSQGGISTPANHPFVFLFTGEQGGQFGYIDEWVDGVFLYTGEGQTGDMSFMRGNRAILLHTEEGKDLHLFKYVGKGVVEYVYQMVYVGYQEREAFDKLGSPRKVIVFELVPADAFASIPAENAVQEEDHWTSPLAVLRSRALASSVVSRDTLERRQSIRYRSNAIRIYVLRRSEGICENCGEKAPFVTDKGRPYLEPHHIRRLSDGGPDHPQWVAALCPNCHRRAHYSADRKDFNAKIALTVKDKEANLADFALDGVAGQRK